MNNGTKTLIFALCLVLYLPVQLPADEDATEEEPPWYEFEVLIFQRIAQGAGSTESWPDDPGAPSLENVISFDTRGRATLKDNLPIPYRPLPAEERRLNDIWSNFRNSRNYRPLYHIAWRQQMVDSEHAQALYLYLPPESGEPGPMNPPKLEGRLQFSVKRYLHMDADILLRLPIAQQADDDFFMEPTFKAYRLHDHRRMRSGKLHYLDHPVLGVLVQAERYEPPVPEPEPEPEPVVSGGDSQTTPAATPDDAKPAQTPPAAEQR